MFQGVPQPVFFHRFLNMPLRMILLLCVFTLSAILHLIIIVLKNRCYQNKKESSFLSSIVEAGWPYALSYVFINFGLPAILSFFGFGALGILPRSIAAWIQSVYGMSRIFSLLQSIGARGGIQNSLTSTTAIIFGSIFNLLFNGRTGRDIVAECLNYYESCLFYLIIFDLFDLLFVVGYWLFRHRL